MHARLAILLLNLSDQKGWNSSMSGRLSRRTILRSGLAGAAFATLPAVARCVDSAGIEIGTDRRLFFDDRLVDSDLTRGVTRVLNPPMRIERVLKPERAVEALGFIFYCSIVDDGGTVRLLHGSYDADRQKHIVLATSEDGIHRERPRLGLREYRGDRDNNLFPLRAVEASVFLDPRGPGPRHELAHYPKSMTWQRQTQPPNRHHVEYISARQVSRCRYAQVESIARSRVSDGHD